MNSAEARRRFSRLAWRDIVEPFPGRLAQTWRIALTCALTTMLAAVYGIPEAAISCYLVFFVMKSDAAEGSILAIALVVLVSSVMVLLILTTRLTIDVPALRLLVIVVASLILLYLGSASLLGELGGIIALVVAFVMTLLDDAVVGEIATRGILYAGLMATMPMACVLMVNLTMGIKPIKLLRQTVALQLLSCAEWLQTPTPQNRAHLASQVREGQEITLKRLSMTRLLALGRRAEIRRLARAARESYRMSIAALALPETDALSTRGSVAAEIRLAAQALQQGEEAQYPQPLSGYDSTAMCEVWNALRDLAGTPDQYPRDAPADSFFRADAVSNPEHIFYAIKTTIAAVICYFVYTAVQWQGIHTALITCYVAALGSVAETTHKLLLRICGCLVGAALGIGSILFIMPHITSVGAIMILVFVGTFVSAWIWVGNERVSYAGVQIALAFLLTVLQGFGPTFDMDTARDRIVGVLLGNCVLFIVFRTLWPASVLRRGWENIEKSLSNLASMVQMSTTTCNPQESRDLRIAYVSKAYAQIADLRRILGLAYFESRRQHPDSQMRHEVKVASGVRRIASRLILKPAIGEGAAQQLDILARRTAIAQSLTDCSAIVGNKGDEVGERDGLLDRDIRNLKKLINSH